jgi:hypothetical protein
MAVNWEAQLDHDQLFKAVLTAHLVAFLDLFFPHLAAQLDLTRVRFVDKELFSAPPMGRAARWTCWPRRHCAHRPMERRVALGI